MQHFRRSFFTVFICFLLIVSCVVVNITPVYASALQPMMVDMFTSPDYYRMVNGEIDAEEITCNHWFKDVSTAGWAWWNTTDYILNSYYFTVICTKKPDVMRVRLFDNQNWFEADYVGNVGNLYQYHVSVASNTGKITVEGVYNSKYTGSFDLVSFVGTRNYSESIKRINVRSTKWLTNNVTGITEGSVLDYWNYLNVPVTKTSFENVNSADWQRATVAVDVLPSYREYDFITDFRMLISGYNFSNFDLQLLDSSYNTVAVIPCDVQEAMGNSIDMSGWHNVPVIFYDINADLSGYDLSGLTIRVNFTASPLWEDPNTKYISYSILACSIEPYIEVAPWYKTFWNWLASKWDKVTSSVTGAISTAADKISNAFSGNSAANQALNQAGSAMSDQANTMNQAQDQLNSVDKPELQPDNLLGNYLAFDTGGLRVLSAITSNSLVTSMLVVVFTFALCGYIFFGKKR